jgi:hypothetical protein
LVGQSWKKGNQVVINLDQNDCGGEHSRQRQKQTEICGRLGGSCFYSWCIELNLILLYTFIISIGRNVFSSVCFKSITHPVARVELVLMAQRVRRGKSRSVFGARIRFLHLQCRSIRFLICCLCQTEKIVISFWLGTGGGGGAIQKHKRP